MKTRHESREYNEADGIQEYFYPGRRINGMGKSGTSSIPMIAARIFPSVPPDGRKKDTGRKINICAPAIGSLTNIITRRIVFRHLQC